MSGFEITCADYHTLREARTPHVLLDVREPWEIALAAITPKEGVTLHQIPLRDLPNRYLELAHAGEIYTLCHHGARSLQGAVWLRQHGFDHVKSIKGGIDEWAANIDKTIARY